MVLLLGLQSPGLISEPANISDRLKHILYDVGGTGLAEEACVP